MPTEVVKYRIRTLYATAAELAAANPVLLEGEPSTESDTGVKKTGDGVTPYNSLPADAGGGGGGGGSPTNLSIANRGASTLDVASSTGADATLPAATTSLTGLLTAADKTKLDGIAAGAEVNVNADWNAGSGDAQILNKPTLGTAAAAATTDFAPAPTTNASVTAGTNAQGSGALTADVNVITSTPNNPSGVTLRAAAVNQPPQVVINRGTNPVNVFPASGAQIDTAGANNPYSLAVGAQLSVIASSTTQWHSSSVERTSVAFLAGTGSGVNAALAVNVGSAGAPVLFNGAGGTPSALTLTNATGLPAAGIAGVTASVLLGRGAGGGTGVAQEITLGSGLSMSGTTLSVSAGGGNVSSSGTPVAGQVAEWATASTIQGVSTTGSGNYVRAVSPVFTTPNLGTPSTINLANATNLAGSALTGAYTAAGLTMATARILGRTTALAGAAEEISVGTNLTLSAGSLSAASTNLGYTASTRVLTSSTGSSTTLPLADGTNPGLFASADFTKLAGVATGATANATDAALRDRATHTGTQAGSTVTGAYTAAGLTMATARLLGRTTASAGAAEEITVGSGLSLTGGTLTATGGGGSITVQDEGSTLSTSVTSINFTGAGVTATGTGSVTVDIPGGGGGGVTSVNITAPAAGITATGGPITSTGSITLALANDLAAVEGLTGTGIIRRTAADTWSAGTAVNLASEITGILPTANGGTGVDNSTGGTANTFWARPNGATGAATYRAIVAADIPTLNQSTTGSAATLTTARTIGGSSFNGSANVTSFPAPGAIGGTTPAAGTFTTLTATGALTVSNAVTVTGGTNAQGQGALTLDFNVVTTTANNPSGVTLPTASAGRRVTVVNAGTNPVALFPATGAQIDAVGANASITVPVGGSVEVVGSSATQWQSNRRTFISPAFTTPALGTPASGTLTNCTGLPVAGVTGLPGTVVGTTETQTLTNKTLGSLRETVFTITDGVAFEINPANGPLQTVTLGANRTPAFTNFLDGQSVKLAINDGTAFTITWTGGPVVWIGQTAGSSGTAPALGLTGLTHVELWREGTTIYGALVGYTG